MFKQPCQRGHLPLNPETLTIENKPVTISENPSKPPNDNIKTKLKNKSTPTMQEACGRCINNITGFKGNKPANVKIAASLPDKLNNCMLISRLTTPSTQRALPRLLQKRGEHSPFRSWMQHNPLNGCTSAKLWVRMASQAVCSEHAHSN